MERVIAEYYPDDGHAYINMMDHPYPNYINAESFDELDVRRRVYVPKDYLDKLCDLEAENAKLREENKRLRKVAVCHYRDMMYSDNVIEHIYGKKKLQELGIEASE